ncbi:MAG: transcriptional regulator [Bacteroidota bacterium]|nr:transcriptional regulator [Bacteroidota bacterium]
MKNHTFTVGKTNTGFDAYYEENELIVAVTTGSNIAELKNNALEAYNLYAEESKKKPATIEQIAFKYDLASFFEFYKEINASALGQRIGMQKSLLSEYVNGKRRPSEKQVSRILNGIKQLGKELSELELV